MAATIQGTKREEVGVQLTVEQHRFELHRSTYMQIFFNSKYYNTAQFGVGCICGCGTVDTEGQR